LRVLALIEQNPYPSQKLKDKKIFCYYAREVADCIKHVCCGTTVDLCSIFKIKSESCSEDYSFCSQSVHHQGEDSPIYQLKSSKKIIDQAKSTAAETKPFYLVSQERNST
jgi:biotin synthase